MKFRPLHDRVVIERIDAEARSAGGIITPDTAKEKPGAGQGHCHRSGRPRRERQAHSDRRRGRTQAQPGGLQIGFGYFYPSGRVLDSFSHFPHINTNQYFMICA